MPALPARPSPSADRARRRAALAAAVVVTLASPGARADTVLDRFAPPRGFTRVALDEGSFGASLRALPLAPVGTPVQAFDGRVLDDAPLAVAAFDVGARDLQQCADSIIRLHAEHLHRTGRADAIDYAFTSGDRYRFVDAARGVRPIVKPRAKVRFAATAPARPLDDVALREYLDVVYLYAGTASLTASTPVVADDEVRPGDFFVLGGFPGHAVLVLDVAVAPDGRRVFLLGEGYMPAQSFHLVPTADGGAWHALDDEGALTIPTWRAPFPRGARHRFPAPKPRPAGADHDDAR